MKLTVLKTCVLALILCCAQSLFAQTANFTTNTTAGCSPLVVTFQNLSSGANSYRWDFGNGNGSLQANPSAIYLNPGVYTVRLIASNGTSSDTIIKTQLITVFHDPDPAFSANSQGGCVPATISFSDNSTPGDTTIVSWLWDFGDGTTSTQQNPSHVYTNPGVYDVTLLIRDANGCTNELTIDDYANITPAPTAAYNASPRWSCEAPLTVNFTNSSTGSGLTYAWDFGDSTSSSQQAPSHTYTAPGFYRVRLTVTDINGCTATLNRNNYIRIYDIQADFTVSDTSVCEGEYVTFTDQSGPDAVSWLWNFGDGNTSTVQNPAHAYAAAGDYTITLLATNTQGCSDTTVMADLITVEAAPLADFTADTLSSCAAPLEVNFADLSTNAVNWQWNFGDGSTSTDENPTHTYTAEGNYNVQLIVTNAAGCTDTLVQQDFIVIDGPTVAIAADTTRGCIDLTINFTDMSTSPVDPIVSWAWDFGDGNTSTQQNPQNTYTQDGVYDVTLSVTTQSGCTSTMTFANYIEAGERPNAGFFGTPLETCLFYPIDFTDTSDIGDFWFWDFGDGGTSLDQNPGYQYGDTGTFTVTLVVGNHGCFDTIIKPDYIRIYPPDARFLVNHNCTDPYTVDFTDISLGGHVWLWDFGTGDTTSIQSPSYTFPSRGNYDVTLTVWDTLGGCFDSLTQSITITDPIAGFSGTNLSGCVQHTVNFTANATDANSYQWFFGDGTSTGGANPSHTYLNTGVYDVTLVVTDIHGCTDTMVQADYVTVYGATANFTADTLTGCTPLAVSYSDASSSFMGNIVSWSWDLGNGDTSSLQNPSTVYTIPGNYTIRLAVTDDNGCTDTLTRVNYIVPTYPTPSFFANDTLFCVGEPVFFSNNSFGLGMNYVWDFGDGDSSFASAPAHTYADTGLYTVSLHVTDINGCDSAITRTNYIRVIQPTANFTVDTLTANCPPLLVNFTDLSPDSVIAWAWDFGDGGTSNLQHPSHVYNRPGVYHPSLVITNVNGCRDTLLYPDSIQILGPWGSFDFVQTTVCVPFEVDFYASGTDSSVLHIWDFGDGDVSVDDDTTSHAYVSPGTYNPVMILDDQMGCVVSIPSPGPIVATDVHADFTGTPDVLCKAGDVYFFDMSSGTPGIVAWEWLFGDGGSSTVQNPIHYYSNPGVYDVTLIATNAAGCMDTIIKPDFVTVHPGPVADFTVNTQAACFPTEIFYTDQSTSDTTIIDWKWYFGDGDSSSAINPSHIYDAPGTYTTTLIVTNARSCTDTTTLDITIHPIPVVSAGRDTAICIGESVTMTGTGGVSYLWSPATGLADATDPGTTAQPTATTTYVLLVTDANGCQNTDTMTIQVNPLPVPVISPDQAICIGQSANLSITGGTIYEWSPAETLNDSSLANPVATPTATTTYQVQVTDANGCQANASTQVTVNPLPVTTITPAHEICEGDTTTLQATGGVFYAWSPAGSLSNPSQAQTQAFPINNRTYVVTVTDANGCVNTDTTSVVVNPLPVIGITQSTDICSGDSIQLNATGGVSYSWSPSNSLTCDNCPNPVSYPDTTTTYTVVVTSDKGCVSTAQVTITVRMLPQITMNNDTLICPGGSAQLTASGGASYSWTPAASLSCANCQSPVATPDSNTTYVVEVTSAYGCVSYDSTFVWVNQVDAAIMASDSAACIPAQIDFTDVSGADSSIVSWNWVFGDGSTSATQHPSHTYTTPGNYIVKLTVTTSTGCTDSTELPITIWGLPVADAGPDQEICVNDTAQLQGSGGITYAWSHGSTLSDASSAGPLAFPLTYTHYRLTVTDVNGCQDTDTTFVAVNPLPNPQIIAGNTVVCAGTAIPLEATGGIDYLWSPRQYLSDTTIANPISTPYGNIRYTVLVTDTNGCQNTESINITANPNPNVIVSPDTAICIGNTVQLEAYGGVFYQWTPATGLNCDTCALPLATPDSTTTYVVTASNYAGCSSTDSITVTVEQLPVIGITADTMICAGETVTLTASGGANYLWSSTDSLSCSNCAAPTVSPVTTSQYGVTVTSAFGCIDSTEVTVAVNEIHADFDRSDSVSCLPADIRFTDLSTSDTTITGYFWSFGDGDTANTATAYHTYTADGTVNPTLWVTNAFGCTDSISKPITLLETPVAQAGADTTICEGTSVQLHGAGGGTYSWNNGLLLNDSTIANPIAYPPVATTFVLTVTLPNGCSNQDSVTVGKHNLPLIRVTGDTSSCFASTITLSASGGNQYIWSPAAGLDDATSANPVAYTEQTTTYTVSVTDANECTATDSVTITVNPLPALVVSAPVDLCIGDTATLTASGGDSYVWSPAASVPCATCPTQTVSPVSNTNYIVEASNQYNCTISDTIPVYVRPLPTIAVMDDATVCEGDAIAITSVTTHADSFLWAPAASLSSPIAAEPSASPTTSTTYQVTVTSEYGCKATDEVTINVIDKIDALISSDTTICAGDAIRLHAEIRDEGIFGSNVQWSPVNEFVNPNAANQTVRPEATTTYTVIISGGACQADTQQITVAVNPHPQPDLGNDRVVIKGDEVELSANVSDNIDEYVWTPWTGLNCASCEDVRFMAENDVTYQVEVTDIYGCKGIDSVNIKVIETCGDDVFIPNSFSPNGDSKNDVLYVRGKHLSGIQIFRIFDRWGNMVYESSDIDQGWNGTYNGKMVNEGVFVYYVEALCQTGGLVFRKGNVTVLH